MLLYGIAQNTAKTIKSKGQRIIGAGSDNIYYARQAFHSFIAGPITRENLDTLW